MMAAEVVVMQLPDLVLAVVVLVVLVVIVDRIQLVVVMVAPAVRG
jgi:hypothetical protein